MLSSSNNSLTSENGSINSCFSSKLRRLKIQENVLRANVKKCRLLEYPEDNQQSDYYNDVVLKKYIFKLKDNFREIKHLFEEIAQKVNEQESFENTDIDDLKRDIMNLETKIRGSKQFIRNELQTLRNEEIALTEKQENVEILSSDDGRTIRRNTSQIKGYKEIVPSPVGVLINSPLKCLEVQQFQQFMKKSTNSYGGWNAYSHNVFVQTWNKYYSDINIVSAVNAIADTFSYQDFKEEILQKTSGTNLDSNSVDSHSKWYYEYLQLKLNQQRALNKWKENRIKIKRPRQTQTSRTSDDFPPRNNTKLCPKQNNGNSLEIRNTKNRNMQITSARHVKIMEEAVKINGETLNDADASENKSQEIQCSNNKLESRLLKPTKLWLIKQKREKETYEFNKNVESIAKLRVPTWRLGLCE